jgi:hypothetical protein
MNLLHKPYSLKGYSINVIKEIPCTDTYIVDIKGKNIDARKVVTYDQLQGKETIVFDSLWIEQMTIDMLKNKR